MITGEDIEAVLNRYGWSHGRSTGPQGELCLMRALWAAADQMGFISQTWLNGLDRAATTLFPERVNRSLSLCSPAQVSDHKDTTREDISLLIKHAGEWVQNADADGR
jgi:hypothetical protein